MNKRISVLSVPIDCVTMDEAVQRILQLTEQPGLHLVATANAEMVMLANENPTLHSILNNASLVPMGLAFCGLQSVKENMCLNA